MNYYGPTTPNYADVRDYKAYQVYDFLQKLSKLESSSGQNTDHPLVTRGLNTGTHAVGDYGLMPLTAQDIDRQTNNNELQDMNKFQIEDYLKQDPELQERLAQTLASKLLQKNDSETAAYKWLNGQNTHPTQDDLDDSSRVRKFRVLSNDPPK